MNANANQEVVTWSVEFFLDHFESIQKRRKFCFLLGAGASRTSGIPLANELTECWIEDIKKKEDARSNLALEQWATADRLGIQGFEYSKRSEFYQDIYKKRWSKDAEAGEEWITKLIDKAKPGIGYYLLAQIISNTHHNIVITTNFDDLVNEAVTVYTDNRAKVYNHEELAQYIANEPSRPQIAKIHGDRLFNQKHTDLNCLPKEWAESLESIFTSSVVIVVGYAGNDGGLINLLNTINLRKTDTRGRPAGEGIYWTHLFDDIPTDRIKNLVAKQGGVFVPILGFDAFTMQLFHRLQPKKMDSIASIEIDGHAKDSLASYLSKLTATHDRLYKNLCAIADSIKDYYSHSTGDENTEATNALLALTDPNNPVVGWWYWELKARTEPNIDERKQIYLEGLEAFPYSHELHGNFAVFAKQHLKKQRLCGVLLQKSFRT